MINFPTRIPDCDSHSPGPLRWEILIMLLSQFQLTSRLYCIAYDYSHAYWDSLRDNLRDVPWEDIL